MIPILLSIAALLLSFYATYRSWTMNDEATRRASRETHIKMIFDVGNTLITSPELWAIYDNHPLAAEKDMKPLAAAKREAFIYQLFNLFDLVRDYYMHLIIRDEVDEDHWQAWVRYIRQLFLVSSEARQLLADPGTKEVYPRRFVDFMDGILKDIQRTGSEFKSAA